MAFKHEDLAKALSYKFKGNLEMHKNGGISTKDGVLINFNPSIGPFPMDAEQKMYVDDYIALASDNSAKDPQADRRRRSREAKNLSERILILEELL